MKAIILISSIFYFLGLLIGNMFHIAKESAPIETIIVNKIKTIQPAKVFHFGEENSDKATPATESKATETKSEKPSAEEVVPESK